MHGKGAIPGTILTSYSYICAQTINAPAKSFFQADLGLAKALTFCCPITNKTIDILVLLNHMYHRLLSNSVPQRLAFAV